VGSHVGGVYSLRVDAPRSLRLFALVEIAIGVFGALSCWIYYDLLYLKASWMYSPAWRAGILHFVGLFIGPLRRRILDREVAAHADSLRALAGEEERRLHSRVGFARHEGDVKP